MRNGKFFVISFLAAAVVLFSACKIEENEWDQALKRLEAEKAAWKVLGITAYKVSGGLWGQIGTAIPIPIVTVLPDREPEVTFVWDEDWIKQNDSEELREHMKMTEEMWEDPDYFHRKTPFTVYEGLTIDALYDSIARGIAAGRPKSKNKFVSMRFNEKYHYPEEVTFGTRQPKVDGGWFTFEITYFEVLGNGNE